ncbi:TIM barrel protein [Nioella aestuarii]|uniref:sugar phosphate isomerase/epimerase family protein n=1 Tax=Nioella aestuarii TaxID=1662864 RepID=UPI003D7FEF3A
MPLTIATSAVPGDLPQKLEAIAAAGFAGVDLAEADFTGFSGSASDLAVIVAGHGLTLNALVPFDGLEGVQGPDRIPAFDRLERVFDRMETLGTELLVLRASSLPDADPQPDRVQEDLSELATRAKARTLRVAYQAVPWARILPHETDAGAFIADKFGAGVQHIALLSDDIFETSDLLATSGFQCLAIPANYYAHIQSVYDLDEALVARVRAENILYARDGGGEYFQIYSLPIIGGFFFEIVERRGGYAGYGARNAPIHIAAQSRLPRPAGMPLQ